VRRLIRDAPPANVPPQVAQSTPFAAAVLGGATFDPVMAAGVARLRSEHDAALRSGGLLAEDAALENALGLLDGAALALPPLERVVADRAAFGPGALRRPPSRARERSAGGARAPLRPDRPGDARGGDPRAALGRGRR
jgi:hypothetical protein